MKTKTQAISEFLASQPCKVDLYIPQMEVQVNTVSGEIASRKPLVYTDGKNNWSPFRIPHNPKDPSYVDKVLDWSLADYATAIGTTGWDWYNRVSRWVGFDFDSVVTHAKGLSDTELDSIRDRVSSVPWITVRRSKSGKGLHLYVHFAKPVSTDNHACHAALARAVLYQLSALLGFNFESKVDTCGGILWVWHREASIEKGSFRLLKQGEPLNVIPDWQQFTSAACGTRRSKTPSRIADDKEALESLVNRTRTHQLDDGHRQLLEWFAKQAVLWWWDAERNMLVCHTYDLKRAHTELKLIGIFETAAAGKDTPNDQNCFGFPGTKSSWTFRRHSPGVKESNYWFSDSSGWTAAYFNRPPTLDIAARMQSGVRTKSGGFKFSTFEAAAAAMEALGNEITIDKEMALRPTTLSYTKDRNIVIAVEKVTDDTTPEGFYKGRGVWEQVVENRLEDPIEPPDHLLRHVVGLGTSEWLLQSRGDWIPKEKGDVKDALLSMGYKSSDLPNIFGNSIFAHWSLACIPFSSEYPGDRVWNRKAPQFSITPSPGSHPNWDSILSNIGRHLAVDDWCLSNGISSGADYIRLWLASMFRYPYEPLPYLFLYGDQDSGKSILHEAAQLMFYSGVGYIRAETALTSTSGFNGELEGAVLCVIEELNLGKKESVNDKVKDWVTAKHLNIRALHKQAHISRNSTHWIQCANDPSYCPVFPGDTRITVVYVERPTHIIPKRQLLLSLTDELPAFLNTLLKTEIPESNSRLNVPVISSGIKEDMAESNRSELQVFITEKCTYEEGCIIPAHVFIKKFIASMGGIRGDWIDQKIYGRLSPSQYPRGKINGVLHIGNMSLKDEPSRKVKEGKMIRVTNGGLE